MVRGLSTVSLYAADREAATRWYTDLLGVEPYFIRPVPPDPPASSGSLGVKKAVKVGGVG